jgi:hypothetical protein
LLGHGGHVSDTVVGLQTGPIVVGDLLEKEDLDLVLHDLGFCLIGDYLVLQIDAQLEEASILERERDLNTIGMC